MGISLTVDAPEHYRKLLAKHYVWMFGISIEMKVAEQKRLIKELLLRENVTISGSAIDLGSGPGYQALALAELGFRPVSAVDNSPDLLSELRERARAHSELIIHLADLRQPSTIEAPDEAHVITCMGDTLTHLQTKEQVEDLFRWSFSQIACGGIFAITYRDLTVPLTGADRFILVRADENKLMTCALEYEDTESVVINDLVHERDAVGVWKLESSSYRKLVIAHDWLISALKSAGFMDVKTEMFGRLSLVTARRFA